MCGVAIFGSMENYLYLCIEHWEMHMRGCEALAESGKAKMKRREKLPDEAERGTTTADNEKSGCECWKIGRI